jgi:hypothetical protein
MPNITIDHTADPVILNFDFLTQQVFTYIVVVQDSAGNELYRQTGAWNATTSFNLGAGAGLVGKYLTITWDVIDPNGAGNPYSATATAVQNNISRNAVQVFAGTTTAGAIHNQTIAQFI